MIIKFSKETSNTWDTSEEFNVLWIKGVREYLYDTFNARGYVYLNEIYQELGIKWDPKNPNPVLIKEQNNGLFMLYHKCENNSFEIEIYVKSLEN